MEIMSSKDPVFFKDVQLKIVNVTMLSQKTDKCLAGPVSFGSAVAARSPAPVRTGLWRRTASDRLYGGGMRGQPLVALSRDPMSAGEVDFWTIYVFSLACGI